MLLIMVESKKYMAREVSGKKRIKEKEVVCEGFRVKLLLSICILGSSGFLLTAESSHYTKIRS